MKNLLQLIMAIILLSITTLYANTTTYNRSDKTQDTEDFVKDFSVSKLVEEEIELIEQKKVEEELEIERKRVKRVSRGTTKSVPRNNTSMKSYMDYRKITNKSSKQYQLQQHSNIYTDEEGFRRIGDKFMIAIGTYFQAEAGQEVEVELSSGSKFRAYVGDIKANSDTDSENLQHSKDGSVVEFIVDSDKLEDVVRKMGDCSYSSAYNFLQGDVISITVLNGKEQS